MGCFDGKSKGARIRLKPWARCLLWVVIWNDLMIAFLQPSLELPHSRVNLHSMRTFLTTIFYLSFAMAALSVAVLFISPFQSQDIILAAVLTPLAILIYLARHAYLVRFGRLGLLKPTLRWKPMKPDARAAALKISAAGFVTALNTIRSTGASSSAYALFYDKMRQIEGLGFDRKSRSDEELLSENKLIRFVESNNKDRSTPPLSELRGVRRKDVFLNLRKQVDDWHAARAASADAYQEWLAEVGDTDQSHLLKDGWIAFLEDLPGPDIHLWHGVATDFHELFGDRLDAAFWIVEQEACDRATASDFIVGYLTYFLSEDYEDITKTDARLGRFLSIIEAYNAGRYKAHSITAGALVGAELDDVAAGRLLTRYEAVQNLKGLPRPKGLIDSTVSPTDPITRGYSSPYAFWDDAGLHLEYPGPNWRDAA